jgi:hypothetical protein
MITEAALEFPCCGSTSFRAAFWRKWRRCESSYPFKNGANSRHPSTKLKVRQGGGEGGGEGVGPGAAAAAAAPVAAAAQAKPCKRTAGESIAPAQSRIRIRIRIGQDGSYHAVW